MPAHNAAPTIERTSNDFVFDTAIIAQGLQHGLVTCLFRERPASC